MLDYLRNLTKSSAEKRQEQLQAYVSGALDSKARTQFEALLADDPILQAELSEYQELRSRFLQLPQRRVPRNFMLDPSLYARPEPQPLFQLVPAMRVATVLTAVFLVIAIGADFVTQTANRAANDVAMAPMALEEGEAALDADSMEAAGAEIAATVQDVEVVEQAVEEEMAEAADMAGESIPATPPAVFEEEALAFDAEPEADDAVMDEAVQTPTPTPTPDTPRIEATATLDNRAADPAGTAVALAPSPAPLETTSANNRFDPAPDMETAVESADAQRLDQPNFLTPLRLTQIGLAILLLGLLMVLQYTRMKL